MTTPAYQGANQPPADRGGSWLGSFGSFFGGAAPQYAAPPMKAMEPTAVPAKVTETTTAVQVTAKETSAECPRLCYFDPGMLPIDPAVLAAGQIVIVIPRNLISGIDPAALAAGQIAIVVPRNLAGADPVDASSAGE